MTSPSVLAFRWSPRSWPFVAVLTGCSVDSYDAAADREVAAILGTADAEVLGNRSDWVVQPAVAPEPARSETDKKDDNKDDRKDAQPEPARPEPARPEPARPEAPKPGAGQPQGAPQDPAAPMLPPPDTERSDLPRALATAVAANRDYQTRKETLYQQGLALSLVRFDFGPQVNATVASVWTDQLRGPGQHQLDAIVTA